MNLSEMLDALERRVEQLLLSNQRLANEMKRRKPEPPGAFGTLFPELENKSPEHSEEEEGETMASEEGETPVRRRRKTATRENREVGATAQPLTVKAAPVEPVRSEREARAVADSDVPASVTGQSVEPVSIAAASAAPAEILNTARHPFADVLASPVPVARPQRTARVPQDPERPRGLPSEREDEFRPEQPRSRAAGRPAGAHPFSDLAGAPAEARKARESAPASPEVPRADVHWSFPPPAVTSARIANTKAPVAVPRAEIRRPDTLRMHMEKAGLTSEEVAECLGVPRASVESWLSGNAPAPSWVPASLTVLGLLTPEARRSQRGPARSVQSPLRKPATRQPGNQHPFARIEDL